MFTRSRAATAFVLNVLYASVTLALTFVGGFLTIVVDDAVNKKRERRERDDCR